MNEPVSAIILPLLHTSRLTELDPRPTLPTNKRVDNFIEQYLRYIGRTEAPQFYHRWCAISIIGGILGRQFYFKRGHLELYPNLYLMLMGEPAARKSTAIKQAKNLLAQTGFCKFASERTTKEKFLLDLSGAESLDALGTSKDDIIERTLFGGLENENENAELFIAADEFNDFTGLGNMEFISLLGSLWDFKGSYESRTKNSKSISVYNPTISILAGNTATGFNSAFPQEVIGQGFFSRLLLIHGQSTGKKIPFPDDITEEVTRSILEIMGRIRGDVRGLATITPGAASLLEKIYIEWPALKDIRFASYSNRRFTHLIKLVLIITASNCRAEIQEEDVIYANTILTHTEYCMPRALGEFGRNKDSDLTHKIMKVLEATNEPLDILKLMRLMGGDFSGGKELGEQLNTLLLSQKIQVVRGSDSNTGYLPKRELIEVIDDGTVDWSILTAEELAYVYRK